MQINGIGNNQIGNSYQNPNRMPNSAMGKKEDDDVSKRLEALGVKVELSFQQPQSDAQEVVKQPVETEKPQESFSVLAWVKKIWDAGIAWLKSIWNDEQGQPEAEAMEAESGMDDVLDADAGGPELFEADAQLVSEVPLSEDKSYAAMYAKPDEEQHDILTDAEQKPDVSEKFRRSGTPLHISGMQDSYNRYGQHSKLGVESANNMTIRK